ncbi:MAG: signal transduction histidine kinase [Cellvibrionaceae bacterium]|jgi:signal transduction histidine kinase
MNTSCFFGVFFDETKGAMSLTGICLILTLLFYSHAPYAQPVNKEKLIVSYSYNFAKNIEWPQEQNIKTFTIALFEVDDTALINEFLKLKNRIRVKNSPVRIIQTKNPQALLSANMVYMGNNEKIGEIQNLIRNTPILLVTSNAQNQRLVMINLFRDQNDAIKFEVNKANLINNQLKALPELILLGGTEIDVAMLYREGQASLINLQNQLSSHQNSLGKLQQQNNAQKTSNDNLINQMRTINRDVRKIKKLNTSLLEDLVILNDTIDDSKAIIAQQKNDITESEKKQKKLARQVEKRNTELKIKDIKLKTKVAELGKKQNELTEISRSITNKESRLSSLNLTIDKQQTALEAQRADLEKQQVSIEALDKLVSAQKMSLYFMIGLAFATTALLCLGIFAYKMKRDDNNRLARRSHDLQIARDKLEVAKRKAEAANRAKGAFLSLMSHELRTPLQSIIGYTDLVIEDLKAEGDTIYSDQLIRVNTNGERLLELINNTLDLAKIEAGKMNVQLTPTHVNSIIEEAVSNIQPLLAKNHNALEIDVDDDTYMPVIDHDKMLHMMVNLLSNATKFTKNGTITITIRNQPNLFKLIISDTGVGLNDVQKQEIFTRFHQVSMGQIKNAPGTGLGLSITQYFCEVMGGTVRAEDRINLGSSSSKKTTNGKQKGSSFIVEIPLPVVIVDKKFTDLEEEDEINAVA